MKGIMPGGEPFFHPGGETGCLLLHGFTATPQEMSELGEYLARLGYTVLGIRLSGHATHRADLARTRWRDWVASATDGHHILDSLCTRIIFVGLSLGGAIALLLATEMPCAGVLAMATPHELPSTPLLRVVRPVLRPLSAVYRFAPKGPPDWRDPEAHKARVHYDHRPLRSVVELDLLLQAMREALPSVKIPVMFIHSDEDTFVPPQHMEANFAALGSADKQKRLVQNSNHVITCDLARHEVFEAAAGFIARVAGPGS